MEQHLHIKENKNVSRGRRRQLMVLMAKFPACLFYFHISTVLTPLVEDSDGLLCGHDTTFSIVEEKLFVCVCTLCGDGDDEIIHTVPSDKGNRKQEYSLVCGMCVTVGSVHPWMQGLSCCHGNSSFLGLLEQGAQRGALCLVSPRLSGGVWFLEGEMVGLS